MNLQELWNILLGKSKKRSTLFVFSFNELLVILLIMLVLFGTKKIRTIGSDLGEAIRNFRQSMREGEAETPPPPPVAAVTQDNQGKVIEGQVTAKQTTPVPPVTTKSE